jgi:Mg-chelatase subunit ChlI
MDQVRAMVEMLPKIEVVADDAFNSDPSDPKNMGPEARQRHAAGDTLPTAHVPTPLVGDAGRLHLFAIYMGCDIATLVAA